MIQHGGEGKENMSYPKGKRKTNNQQEKNYDSIHLEMNELFPTSLK